MSNLLSPAHTSSWHFATVYTSVDLLSTLERLPSLAWLTLGSGMSADDHLFLQAISRQWGVSPSVSMGTTEYGGVVNIPLNSNGGGQGAELRAGLGLFPSLGEILPVKYAFDAGEMELVVATAVMVVEVEGEEETLSSPLDLTLSYSEKITVSTHSGHVITQCSYMISACTQEWSCDYHVHVPTV